MEAVGAGHLDVVQFHDPQQHWLQHAVISMKADGDFHTVAECGIDHGEEMEYMDCPVASRWTIVRAVARE